MKKIISILTLSAVGIVISSNASALGYSDNVGVNFTFDQSLTVSLSSADIVINNLAPGSASDSNAIDINVLSNNLSGYTLTSTVGNDTHTNPSYDNTNLTHTGNSSNTFAGLSTSDSVSDLSTYDTSSLTNPNVWGYSYSDQTVDNPTWSNYSGLPLYDTTGVTLKTSTTPSAESGDTIKFKIAAKASTTLAPGEYRNVINFTVTAEHNPVSFYDAFKEAATRPGSTITTLNGYYKMQDMTADICSSIYTSQLADNTDTMEAQLIDIRDNNIYWVAKLKDGHCWMTQNLDHNIVTEENFYTYDNTDIGHGSTVNADAKWTADKATYATGVLAWATSTGAGRYIQESYDPGDTCWDKKFYDGSGERSEREIPCDGSSDLHYHIGNYYNWTAAVAMNDSDSVVLKNQDAEQSICPAEWRLPRGGTSDSVNEFYILYDKLNLASGPEGNVHKSPVYFVYAGAWLGADAPSSYIGYYGYYWSSMAISENNSSDTRFGSDGTLSARNNYPRRYGFSVRCLAR